MTATGVLRTLTVLVAPDSFKGSLTSIDVARALAAGWLAGRPGDEVLLAPLADGGEGTLAAIDAAGGWSTAVADAHDPLGRAIRASWLRSADGTRAVVELAAASGLSRLAPGERSAEASTTGGTGEVLGAVLDAGVRQIALGIGGSATTDGGWGILHALGAECDGGVRPTAIDLRHLDPRLAETQLEIACDVTNPLLGSSGAAATYGPQKGASPEAVRRLDAELGQYANALEAATGRLERETPGAGAAGGTGFGLLCLRDRFRSLVLRPGVDLVMEAVGFDERLARADVVLTGEGRIDAQTAFGKTALGVALRAHGAGVGVACVAFGGGVEPDGAAALGDLGAIAVPVAEGPASLDELMAAGVVPLERAAERVARLVSLGAAFQDQIEPLRSATRIELRPLVHHAFMIRERTHPALVGRCRAVAEDLR